MTRGSPKDTEAGRLGRGKVTLPNHKGDIPIGTLNSIWKQARLK
ncbi:type II toxin-antitoxin system HicA family toxin [Desulfosporosinus sp. OT]|nr:type II toxin-antitoxin system HicA family toxin [Desulfosporosinus sp. OT]